MSTLSKVNFEPVSDVLPVWRRDLPLADPTLADPLNSVALVDGEWVTFDANYKWVRAALITAAAGTAATVPSFPVFNERGRSDRLGMAERKTTALQQGPYEYDTRIFDAAIGASPITAVNQPLKVAVVEFSGRKFIGLIGHGGTADTDPIVGYVTKLPANNGGKLRFRSGSRH